MNDRLDDIESEMKNLKSFLYARFGSAINLEEEWVIGWYFVHCELICIILI